MRKNIFGIRRINGGIVLDSFFTELVLIIPVFAVSCCAVLQMFSIAADTAHNREIKASAIACAQSWCELYSAGRSSVQCAEELFGSVPAFSGTGVILADSSFSYDPEGDISIIISESSEDTASGQLKTSVINIIWQDGELSESAARYVPDFVEDGR